MRALRQDGPFLGGQAAGETVEQPVQDGALALGDHQLCGPLPEPCLSHHGGERRLSAVEGAAQAGKEPLQPRRDVERTLLGSLQDVVVGVALLPDLRGHAVEALRAVLRARELPVGNRAGDAAVAVLERVDRDEPQMRERRAQHRVRPLVLVRAGEELRHLVLEAPRHRRFEVHLLFAEGTRYHLHWPGRIVPPRTDDDLPHAAAPRGEQRRVPTEEPIGGERRGEILSGIEHHLDGALHVPVRRLGAACIQAQASGERGSDLLGNEVLAFDLAGLEHIERQGFERGLLSQREAQPLHPAQQSALPVADDGQGRGQGFLVPVEPRPGRQLMDKGKHSTHQMRRIWTLFDACQQVSTRFLRR